MSATGSELVMTVSRGTAHSASATAYVVLPAESATELPGSTRPAAARAMARFSASCSSDLTLNSGSSAVNCVRDRGRPAVHPGHQTPLGEHLDVPAHGHVRDSEPLDEVGDAGAAVTGDLLEDRVLTLPGQHQRAP